MKYALSISLAFLLSAVPGAGVAQDAPPPAVVVAAAQLTDLSDMGQFNGRLEADRRVDILARVSGILMETAFSDGDIVEEGDLLFRIEDDLYRAAVKEAEGTLRSAEAELRLAVLDRDRQAELVERGTVSQATLDVAEATLGNFEGAVIRAEAALQRAQLNLSYTEITAPFSGRMGVAVPDVGALIGPESGSLVRLTRLNPIRAEFSVSTASLRQYAERVAAGTASNRGSARLILADGSIYDQNGDIDFIDAAVNGGQDSVRIRALFQNDNYTLLDGELVRVVVVADDATTSLTVPQRGIQRDLQGDFVFSVTAENVVELQRVVVDRVTQGLAVISSGLSEGDLIVVDGTNKVRPGITVDAALEGDG